ncbi:MAG TPA: hypothetical protein PLD20_01765 [Blastocatellia bacterium]|nr:hypothetical protein [Blastocatellia bacterium]HMV87428.1 hypothetical protein [Blastocatellia bacterium]HMX24597.1 hypothetical protein [Blastocatellia bacterium]HMY73658.1 hypothetical protein [Blastocatellia bacterium]HMZ16663.1 hypothetical protein [Blastocatellia bacterium]
MASEKRKGATNEVPLTPNLKKQLKGLASGQATLRVKPVSRKKKVLAAKVEPAEASTNTQAKAPKKKTSVSSVQAKKPKKELTAREATLLAWQDTYAKRHKRAA